MTLKLAASRRGAKTAAWVIADQAVSSGTNFVVSIAALRILDVEAFGAFSLAILAYQLLMRATRALVSQPLMARYSTADPERRHAAGEAALGATLVAGVGSGIVLALLATAFGGYTRLSLLVLAPFLPGLLVQDGWRHVFLTDDQPRMAFINDAVWALAQIVFMVAVWLLDLISLGWILGAWAAAATIAAVAGNFQGSRIARPASARRWFRENGRLGLQLAGEILVARGVHQVSLFVLAAMVGLAALGGINGMRVLLGPINVFYLGVFSFGVAEGARWLQARPTRFRDMVNYTAIGLAVLPVVAATMLWAFPDTWMSALTGGNWLEIRRFLVPVTVIVAAQGWMNANRIGLSVLEDGRRSLQGQLLGSPGIVVGTVAGALVGGELGGAVGMAGGFVLAAVLYFGAFRSSLRSSRRDNETIPPESVP